VQSEIFSPLSPLDTYELSDAGESGSESDDSEDRSHTKKPKKYIPTWAQKSHLYPKLDTQYAMCGPDPDQIFGEVETCDLQAIFAMNKSRYKQRSSSGMWSRDRATGEEKQAYKRSMHFGMAV
jgi:hypothetical protein